MKGPEAFRTISEAAAELGVPQHVLRFWETKFSFIRPMKRAGGRRFYRRQDIDVLRGVRALLHGEGYTIKGVQRLHKEQGVRRLVEAGAAAPFDGEALLVAGPLGADADAPPERFDHDVTQPPEETFVLAAEDAAEHGAVIDKTSRERLAVVLAHLEAVKAKIDGLLAHKG
jgi:DNA-binding transcriptional MerR regulator